MTQSRGTFGWLLALLLTLFAAPLAAQDFPARPEGPILDAAGLLEPAEEAALEQQLTQYNAETGRALVVATVPDLQGQTIEQYSADLFREWGIGGAARDQGLLLLVAPSEREVRIEVGYGLTPYVTDILSGRIIREQITPAFREGNFAAGIAAGLDALITQLNRSPEDAAAVAEAAAAAERAGGRGEGVSGGTIAGAVFWGALILGFMLIFGRGRGRRRHRRYGAAGAIGQVLLWHAVGSAMGHASRGSGGFGGGGFGGGGGGGFGGFGGGMSGGGGASGSW